jgi:diguanylate cyclase (GGDEF)-like protein
MSRPRLRGANTPDLRVADVDPYSHDSTAAAVEKLSALVEAQARTIRDQQAAQRSLEIFERASAAARLGIWECDLRTEKLAWSNGTYDMFDIARGRPLVRNQTLRCYPDKSLKELEVIRGSAIRARRGFNLDSEICTRDGKRRWIRITAAVECAGESVIRLFGIKQDITEERMNWERTRHLAEFDELTGLANRRQFRARIAEACRATRERTAAGALLLVDLDGFKEVNDSLGHAQGDACLQEAAQRMKSACPEASLVARIGGDEFAVLLPAPHTVIRAGTIAARIITALSQPSTRLARTVRLGASVGIAPVHACTPEELFRCADVALYAAKAAGRNTFRICDPRRMPGASRLKR